MISEWLFLPMRFCVSGIMGQTKEQIKYILGVSSHGYDRSNMDDDESERMKKDIEASQDNALNLCTEKVLLARQAYDLVLLPSCCFPVVLGLRSLWYEFFLILNAHLVQQYIYFIFDNYLSCCFVSILRSGPTFFFI